MGPETLAAAELSWFGVPGDRRWAFIRPGVERSGFPWLTLREHTHLALYRPAYVDPDRPDASATVVRTPQGAEPDVTDPALRAELGSGPLRVIRQDRGVFDASALALVTTRTIAALGAMLGVPIAVQRFRPNFLIEAHAAAAFQEDEWVGCELRIGTMRMRVDKRDGRCGVINVDPQTGVRNPAVLRAVAQERWHCVGVYGTTVRPGRVTEGDRVFIEAGP